MFVLGIQSALIILWMSCVTSESFETSVVLFQFLYFFRHLLVRVFGSSIQTAIADCVRDVAVV